MGLGLLLRVHWPMVDNSKENYFLLHPLLYCCETAAAADQGHKPNQKPSLQGWALWSGVLLGSVVQISANSKERLSVVSAEPHLNKQAASYQRASVPHVWLQCWWDVGWRCWLWNFAAFSPILYPLGYMAQVVYADPLDFPGDWGGGVAWQICLRLLQSNP